MKYLLLGGPAHGDTRDLKDGETETVVTLLAPDKTFQSFTYVLREVQAETRPGFVYRQHILAEKSMPVDVASQALASLLLQNFAEELVRQFMEGGELVGNDSE